MAEHMCEEHKTKFFKTANMFGYAHPIKVEDQTVGWCNEDAKEVAKLKPKEPMPIPPYPGEEKPPKSRSQEIAEHVWWKELGEMLRAKDIDMTKPAGKLMRTAYYAQMMSVLDLKIENK